MTYLQDFSKILSLPVYDVTDTMTPCELVSNGEKKEQIQINVSMTDSMICLKELNVETLLFQYISKITFQIKALKVVRLW